MCFIKVFLVCGLVILVFLKIFLVFVHRTMKNVGFPYVFLLRGSIFLVLQEGVNNLAGRLMAYMFDILTRRC